MNWDYIAGFIDGEGSIIIKPPRVRLYISNTNKEILDRINKFMKCGKVYSINRNLKLKWKKQYGWTVGNHKEVLIVLKKLRNRLLVKKEKCEEAIKYIENKRWLGDYLSKEELEKFGDLTYRKIAKQLGVSPYCVFRYLRKYDLR